MHDLVGHSLTAVAAFFAIMNPVANTPVFLGLTAADDSATRKLVAFRSLFIAFLIIVVFTLAGNLIFQVFGITLFAFRVTGGILVFGIGYSMLHGEAAGPQRAGQSEETPSRDDQLSVAISPLAVPIFAGPGTIATAMNSVADGSLMHVGITIGAFGAICLVSYVFFVSGERLVRYLGENAVDAITKMMGLILAVIGVQMFIEGAYGAVRAFH